MFTLTSTCDLASALRDVSMYFRMAKVVELSTTRQEDPSLNLGGSKRLVMEFVNIYHI